MTFRASAIVNAGCDRKLTVCFTVCPSIPAANGHEIVAQIFGCRSISEDFLF